MFAPHSERDHLSNLIRRGEFDAAYEVLERLMAAYPNDPDLWLDRGHLFASLENYGAAAESATKAVELRGSLGDLFTRARYLFQVKAYDSAVRDLTAILETASSSERDYYESAARLFRADALFRLGRFAECAADAALLPAGFKMWTDNLRSSDCILAEARAELRKRV